jgi:site-specific recombinase XerD
MSLRTSEIVNQFQIYLKNKSLRSPTIRGYAVDVMQFTEWTETNGVLLNNVTEKNANEYLDYLVASRHEIRPGLMGTYSSSTIMKKISAIRSFFDFLRGRDE